MPTYVFQCADGSRFEASYPLTAVPAHAPCDECGSPARRIFTAPHLSKAGSSAYRLLDRTRRSADQPEVVTGLPGRRTGPPQRYTANPLHQKLPRP